MTRRNWNRIQPTSLRHALELCKDHAREKLNKSVEGIAADMGLADHWSLYKWFQNGRIPTNLVRPFENACGIDFVTRWMAVSSGRLLVPFPNGRSLTPSDIAELHNNFGAAMKLLIDFYAKPGDPSATAAALTSHMEHVGWHRANVATHQTPQLEL